ncbi:MAG: Rpn family recombination-promoting nuclease/putative transposase [Tannerella sp.]|nr:Rpn family recombination-promoting nuclease/putative transposase [Tannerella sp.]
MEEKADIGDVYLNPRTDFGFKKIFLDKDLLIDFLNVIINEEARITDVEYRPSEMSGEWDTDRKAVFDLYCKNSNDEHFIVEMQRYRQTYFIDRSLFYASAAIRSQAPRGKWNYELKAVYFIAILDCVAFEEEEVRDTCIERAFLYREQARKRLSDRLSMIFVELPKFTKTAEELSTNTERWLFLLKNLERLNARPPEVRGEIFERLFRIAEIKKLTEREMEEYRTSIFEYDSVKDAIAYSSERALKKGYLEGQQDMIKQFLREGMSLELLSKYTGLTVEQIEAISKSN